MQVPTPQFQSICDALAGCQSSQEVFSFLRDLLSDTEIQEFGQRFAVAQMLYEQTPYIQITKQTGMSSTTIARINKFLTGPYRGYVDAITRLQSVAAPHHHAHGG